jgi:hypothetical protein
MATSLLLCVDPFIFTLAARQPAWPLAARVATATKNRRRSYDKERACFRDFVRRRIATFGGSQERNGYRR